MKTSRRSFVPCLLALLAALVIPTVAAATDEIVLSGIPMRGIEIHSITEGDIVYSVAGRSARRPSRNVIIHLDEIPDIERGENAFKAKNHARALAFFDRALTKAKEPWQRAWIDYRRAAVYSDQGRFTRAAAAWGQLLEQQPDTYWAIAMPACPPDKPVKSEVENAINILVNVQNDLRPGILEDAVSATLTTLRDLEKTAPDKAPDPEPDPGDLDAPDDETPSNDAPVLLPPPPTSDPDDDDAGNADQSRDPYGIDALIEKGDYRQARRIVERLVAQTGGYPLDRLLYQYGQVLAAQDEDLDAAVRFMQCAILFPDGNYAAASLYETARLHAGPLKNKDIARRLFVKARDLALAQNRPEIAKKATEDLEKLGP